MSLGIKIDGFDLDLFKSDDVILNAVTKDLTDPSKIFSDYSQQFSVPASNRNNIVFRHFYNVDLNHVIDVRKTIPATILMNGNFFRSGKIVLLGVNMVNNKVDSYRLQFIGGLKSLSDSLKGFNLADLDYSSIAYTATKQNVIDRLSGSVAGNVIYTLLSSTYKFFYDSTNSQSETDLDKNLFRGVDWFDLSPSVSASWLMMAIFNHSNINVNVSQGIYDILQGMYLLYDIGAQDGEEYYQSYRALYISNSTGVETNVISQFTTPVQRQSRIDIRIIPSAGFEDFEYQLRGVNPDNDQDVYSNKGDAYYTGEIVFQYTMFNTTSATNLSRTLNLFIKTKFPMEYEIDIWERREFESGTVTNTHIGQGLNAIEDNYFDLNVIAPDVTFEDFISSFVKMFNLVVIPTDSGFDMMRYIEWKSQGVKHDITKYVVTDKFTIDRLSLPESFKFTFKESDSPLMQEFKKRNGRVYGDLDYTIDDESIYTTDDAEVELIFGNAIFERLSDLGEGLLTSIGSGYIAGAENLLHYALGSVFNDPIKITTNGEDATDIFSVWNASHMQSFEDSQNSLVFGSEYDDFTLSEIDNTLYKNHFEDGVRKLYNKESRALKQSAIVSDVILHSIKNNDVVVINGVEYEIVSMTMNLNTNKIDFDINYYSKQL